MNSAMWFPAAVAMAALCACDGGKATPTPATKAPSASGSAAKPIQQPSVSASAKASASARPVPSAAVAAGKRQGSVPALPAATEAIDYERAGELVRPGDAVRLEVLNLGTEPRQKLRHAPALGDGPTLNLNIELKQVLRSSRDAFDSLVPQPVLEVTLRTVFREDKDPDDDRKWMVATIEAITPHARDVGEEKGAAMLRPALRKAIGQTIVVSFTERMGHLLPLDQTVPVEALQILETIRDGLRELVIALPEPAIGAEGAWWVMSRASRAGVERIRLSTYRVMGVDEKMLKLDVRVEERAIAGAPKSKAIPDDVVLEVLRGEGAGHFSLERPRASLLPQTMMGKGTDRVEMNTKPPAGVKVAKGGYKLTVKTEQTLKVKSIPSRTKKP